MEKFGVIPGEADRRAGADRRFRGQRARRAGHRPEERGAAHRRIRRPRNDPRRRAGDEAVQAARHAARARGEGAHLARAGDAARRRAAAACRWRNWRCASRSRDRLAAWLREQGFRSTARLGLEEQAPAPAKTGSAAGKPELELRRSRRRCPPPEPGLGAVRAVQTRHHPCRPARLDRRSHHRRHGRHRYRNRQPESDAGEPGRFLARHRPGRACYVPLAHDALAEQIARRRRRSPPWRRCCTTRRC